MSLFALVPSLAHTRTRTNDCIAFFAPHPVLLFGQPVMVAKSTLFRAHLALMFPCHETPRAFETVVCWGCSSLVL